MLFLEGHTPIILFLGIHRKAEENTIIEMPSIVNMVVTNKIIVHSGRKTNLCGETSANLGFIKVRTYNTFKEGFS